MLTSFFSKSKPINIIALSSYMLILFIATYYKRGIQLEGKTILWYMLGLIIYTLLIFLFNLIIQNSDFAEKGTYTILLFTSFVAILPNSYIKSDLLISLLFILLAIKKIVYLKNQKHVKAKIFDASLYIGLASLVYFWSVGYYLIVFLSILYIELRDYRNWLIPVLGLTTIYLSANCFTLFYRDSFFSPNEYISTISFSFENYLSRNQLISTTIILIITLLFSLIYLIKHKLNLVHIRSTPNLVIGLLLTAFLIIIIVPNKNTSEFIFLTIPLSIMGTTYLEMNHSKLAKEINLWMFLLFPLIILMI